MLIKAGATQTETSLLKQYVAGERVNLQRDGCRLLVSSYTHDQLVDSGALYSVVTMKRNIHQEVNNRLLSSHSCRTAEVLCETCEKEMQR